MMIYRFHCENINDNVLSQTNRFVINTQCCRYYASVSMNESIIANVATAQRRRFYANILMNESTMTNVLTTQLGTSCSFDSPGLARNEPTLGKYSQGDSTP